MVMRWLLKFYLEMTHFLSHFIEQRSSGSQLTSKEVSQGNVTDENGAPAHSGLLVISRRKWEAEVLFATCKYLETRPDFIEGSKIYLSFPCLQN